MRKGFAISLMFTVLFAGGYLYYVAQAVCSIPISYHLGELDERFGLTREEALLAIAQAESAWEDATGKNLFSYEENGTLTINFTYDERQQFVEAEDELKDKLDATENISEAIGETYASLVSEYKKLELTYKDRVEAYERRLNTYNRQVERYNSEGGAPPEVYEELESQKQELAQEQKELEKLEDKLGELVAEINNIGERGNTLINVYNKGVETYNETFGEGREFTQGDYTNDVITIYTFEDQEELGVVLAHELGHALSLGHVDNSSSVMHYLIGDQDPALSFTEEDLREFEGICGERSLFERISLVLFPKS